MRVWLTLGAAAALLVVAACNRDADSGAQPPSNSESSSSQVGNGSSGSTDVATIMHDRHERYEEIGKAMKGIGRELKADAPSIEALRRHAGLIARYAPQIPSWFPAGTGPETGIRTHAKAEIWSDNRTFRQRAAALRVAADRFNQAAQGGDVAAIRAAQPGLSDACKNCHDRFRTREGGH